MNICETVTSLYDSGNKIRKNLHAIKIRSEKQEDFTKAPTMGSNGKEFVFLAKKNAIKQKNVTY